VRRVFLSLLVLLALGASACAWWLHRELTLSAATVDLSIDPGTSVRGVAQAVQAAGVDVDPGLLYWWFRLSGQARQIKAGSYELERGATAVSLLRKLVRGEEALRVLIMVEGWNFSQLRAAMARAENLKPDSASLNNGQIMAQLGRPDVHPEGRFYPDSYAYAKGSSDIALLKRAMRAMDQRLEAAWNQRAPDCPLKSAEEALILASIVEKETGRAADRAMIAGVFSNRLRQGMPLQTDPSVIYGLGERFDGNLRKRDLLRDTPWNTYTRGGLPPTPIAMPGKAALLAAVQPAPTKALYFVARGDGSSQFSSSLEEHNRAVNKYQRAP